MCGQQPSFNQIEESINNAEEITVPNKEVHSLVSNIRVSPAATSDKDIDMLMLGGDGSMMNVKDSYLTTN